MMMSYVHRLIPTRKIRPKRKHTARSSNPLRTMSSTVEIRTEYEEVIMGTAEKELKRMKTAASKEGLLLIP